MASKIAAMFMLRFIFLFLSVFIFVTSAAAEVTLTVQLDRTYIYEGETLFCQLILADSQPIDGNIKPEFSALTDFAVQALARQEEQSGGMMQKIIINGKVIKDESSGSQYRVRFGYILTPLKTGSLVIPLPKIVNADGKQLSLSDVLVISGSGRVAANNGNIPIQVQKPVIQDDVLLDISVNRQKLYPLQVLELTLSVQIKALPDKYAGKNPLEAVAKPPMLQIPWLEIPDTKLPKGLTAVKPIEAVLEQLYTKSGRGFAVNSFGGNQFSMGNYNDDGSIARPFAMSPFKKVLFQFSGTPKIIKRPDADGKEHDYWQYRFVREFLPKETGTYSFGPVTLKGAVPVANIAGADEPVQLRDIYTIAKPVTITVSDVPAVDVSGEKRPADYIGAFGTFRFEADIEPKKTKVGDPITLTLKLTGKGSTAGVKAPELSNSAIQDLFRVHTPPTEENNGQSCIYTYTVRPKKSGQIEFPPQSVSVFNVETEKFVRLESLPITLDVSDAETIQSATVYGEVPTGGGTEEMTRQIAHWAIMVSKYLGISIGTLFGLLVLWKSVFWTAAYIHRQRTNRRNAALRRAKQQLSLAQHLPQTLDTVKALQAVFFGYAADKTDGIAEGMTTLETINRLCGLQLNEALLTDIQRFLEVLDAVQYGGQSVPERNVLLNEAETLLRRLE
ncbi:MAG: BatD family protein [Planctomycetaceae bacterium]|jgi:hypothetical protein|nr:BatD family protein [Planctomycetaceae bacterium]